MILLTISLTICDFFSKMLCFGRIFSYKTSDFNKKLSFLKDKIDNKSMKKNFRKLKLIDFCRNSAKTDHQKQVYFKKKPLKCLKVKQK